VRLRRDSGFEFWVASFVPNSTGIETYDARRKAQGCAVPFRNNATKQLLFSVAAGPNAAVAVT
jgi:hypothetical protein